MKKKQKNNGRITFNLIINSFFDTCMRERERVKRKEYSEGGAGE